MTNSEKIKQIAERIPMREPSFYNLSAIKLLDAIVAQAEIEINSPMYKALERAFNAGYDKGTATGIISAVIFNGGSKK